ncbi:MAG: hypothetical protein M3463_17100 [Verrucomicrobiota bacterium]|nr:hypothetical protein [Verrucomicrobiota bacterium]
MFGTLGWPADAPAVIVTNVTAGTVIFNSSGFEHDAPGHEPFASLQKSAAPKPWKTAKAPWDEVLSRVDRSIHLKPPAGGEGLRYLKTTRDATGEGNPIARFSSIQSRVGDLIRMEFSLQLPADADARIYLGHEGRGACRGLLRLPDFNATIAWALGLPLDKEVLSPSQRPLPWRTKASRSRVVHLTQPGVRCLPTRFETEFQTDESF